MKLHRPQQRPQPRLLRTPEKDMSPNIPQDTLNNDLRERFNKLPKVVQDAITSADIQKRLRELAEINKLHVDQWQLLENEVMLTLLGFQAPDELAGSLKSDLNIPEEVSLILAQDISKIVFEPIRQELERELEHPDAKAAVVSDVDAARTQILSSSGSGSVPSSSSLPPPSVPAPKPIAPPVAPATPPPPPPTEKVARPPLPPSEELRAPSHERKIIEGDPYREQIR